MLEAHDPKEDPDAARVTPRSPRTGGVAWWLLVEEERLSFEAAAAASNVARSTAHTWVTRWREAGEEERRDLSCLTDRSSRPHTSPAQVPEEEARQICERRERTGWSPRRLADEPDIARPASTVHRVLRRGGCSRRPRPEPPAVVRYEWPCPGNLLHMDVKKLGRFDVPGPCADRRPASALAAGRLGVRALDRRRLLAAGLRGDPRRRAGRDRRRASPAGPSSGSKSAGSSIERLMTDNHFSYTKSSSLARAARPPRGLATC